MKFGHHKWAGLGMNNKVALSLTEVLQAANAGIYRVVENIKINRGGTHGLKNNNDWNLHIEGALAECALAKFLNVYWEGKGSFNGVDVGSVDARSTRHEKGCLIIHPSDDDNRKYYLLTGFDGNYIVRGWIWGRDAKNQIYWTDPTGKNRPAYFIPQSKLNGVDAK